MRLRPAPHAARRILSYSLRVEPAEHFINWQQDPSVELPGAAGVPREDDASSRSRSTWSPRWRCYNPFDFFLEPSAENFPFSYDPSAGARARALPAQGRPPTPRFAAYLDSIDRSDAARPSTSWSSSTSGCRRTSRYLIRMEPGVQTPEQTLANAQRLVPRHRLAAGAAAAPPRPRGALRLGLPDPAQARREVARRPERHRGRLHRPARLVRGLPAGRRLDRPRPDLGPAAPARATSRSPARPSRRRAAPISGAVDECEVDVRARDVGARASGKRRASPSPTPKRSGPRSTRSATRSTPTCVAQRRAPDDGRRADLRLGRRPRRRRVEHRRAGPDQARAAPPS